MFHGRQINDKINIPHKRALRIMILSLILLHHFKNCWLKIKVLYAMHHQNIQSNIHSLANKLYKAVNNLPGGNLSKSHSRSEQTIPNINTLFF